ncbi:unnamed protein product [Rhizopus stolonifer]
MGFTYKEAVDKLNSLQSGHVLLEKFRKTGSFDQSKKQDSLTRMKKFLGRIGYTPKDFDQLKLIHVTGTKGKGSTSAFTQSILHNYDPSIKTGMFTSPHLVAVRERIRINGKPISEELFAKYFQEVWDRLEATKEEAFIDIPRDSKQETIQLLRLHPDKPAYFRYLALVALHAFVQEKVDCAILEVGVGGENDSTNIIERPVVCGITALGLDHTSVLGDTIDKIAWHKAGIFKPNVPAVYFEQLPEATKVIIQRAQEKNVPLTALYASQISDLEHVEIGLAGRHQKHNALIAIELCKIWLKSVRNIEFKQAVPEEFKKGLRKVSWPGRSQQLNMSETKYDSEGNVIWYLDGAHTAESLQMCTDWFQQVVRQEEECHNILVFNCTHGRDSDRLLETISKIQPFVHFEDVVFTTNITFKRGYAMDNTNNNVSKEELTSVQKALTDNWSSQNSDFPKNHIHTVGSIEEAVEFVLSRSKRSKKTIQVLTTGSLIMVGNTLTVLGFEPQ